MKQWFAIKEWFFLLPREARALAVAGAVFIAFIFLFWLSSVVGLLLGSMREAARVEPQIARLLGYEQVGNEFDLVLEQSILQLRELSYEIDEGAQAGARLQQSLRSFAEESGLVVTGSQLLAEDEGSEEEEKFFEVLSVDLSLQGTPLSLDLFLREIQLHTPKLAVSNLNLVKPRNVRQRRGAPAQNPDLLNIRMTVVGLRELRR